MTEKFGKISKGRIALYSDRGRLIESRIYYTAEGMKKIMAKWMMNSPDKFYIQVRPYIPDEKKQIIRLDIVKPFTRPPAIYDNNHSLYEK